MSNENHNKKDIEPSFFLNQLYHLKIQLEDIIIRLEEMIEKENKR